MHAYNGVFIACGPGVFKPLYWYIMGCYELFVTCGLCFNNIDLLKKCMQWGVMSDLLPVVQVFS